MSQLIISTISATHKTYMELTGTWRGKDQPPSIVKSFYYVDDEIHVDRFQLFQMSRYVDIEVMYRIGSRIPSHPQTGAMNIAVTYKWIGTDTADPAELVSDYFIGEDPDEYVTWDLVNLK